MKLLLHSCCAPCSAAIIEYLLQINIKPVIFYFNPNIFPKEEYEKRKNELTKYAAMLNLEVIDGDYNHDLWLSEVKNFENEPERGIRCMKCFSIRLSATAKFAHENGFDTITSTLGSSRWKNLKQISEAGKAAVEPFTGLTFWDKNWRKDGLSERRNFLIHTNNFYNQVYCGCEFSVK
ncbi:MAG: epoxyqueuosine reductase QueH [Dysgonamonadaceae bacterium]|jgi:predicted adenine nucleotide alpha hydrolase (AANH) superfamily ATPase|nr:epoxyqueuosine reductase QueH [Dysgonamonadaceae bacterium]